MVVVDRHLDRVASEGETELGRGSPLALDYGRLVDWSKKSIVSSDVDDGEEDVAFRLETEASKSLVKYGDSCSSTSELAHSSWPEGSSTKRPSSARGATIVPVRIKHQYRSNQSKA